MRLVDDLTGEEAAETVEFGFDGRSYEIDLTAGNARAFRDALATYVAAARRAAAGERGAGRRSSRAASAVSAAESREQNRQVREWARQNGFTVSERGRIPAEVLTAYAERTGSGGAQSTEAQSTEARPTGVVQFSG
ncbi:Histone protein Lsr2 [Pseudonocardia sp. Ae168_Ps1]|nr:Histone protein Lsr2 [Pseudonocardia sp. Ae168_Ps1]OLL70398.1 Histone protein Lsr2 [Pseudonocardia sp. Ae263_Ps1]OLL89179.1 Histone protein Lsr2 [Pseudonocardia sp. Ae356_Ps1]